MPAPALPSGPSAAEERMLKVYDTFERLLNTKPRLAAELSYAIATVAEHYNARLHPAAPQPKKGTSHHG